LRPLAFLTAAVRGYALNEWRTNLCSHAVNRTIQIKD
jgi:hypothetical protein